MRYVLEGSVQRDGNRVRVNAQLVDGETGAHLWADRFEDDLADLFKLQDQVVARLANALGYELVKAEAGKGAHSTNPNSIDLTMRGWALLNVAGRDPAQYEEASALFARALELDSRNVEAMIGVALIDIRAYTYSWATHHDDTLRSTPALPLLPLTCRNASFRFARSHISSMIRLVLAGRSGSLIAESDSMSSRPACRASLVGADEKSNLNWMFGRLSLSRFMSYLPLLSFGPSVPVPGAAYLLTPPFGDGVPH